MFLFFIFIKFNAFHITQNETPQMIKMSASTNKMSQNFAEHIEHNIPELQHNNIPTFTPDRC